MVDEKPSYAQINRKVWNTHQFRALSRDARELFFYLTTCPHGNMLGIYVLRPGYALDDLQWGTDRKRFTEPLSELLKERLFENDPQNDVVLDLEQIQKHPPENGNQVKAALKIINTLPNTPLFHTLKLLVEQLNKPFLEPLVKRLGERYAKPVTVTVPEAVTEKYISMSETEKPVSDGNGKYPPCPQTEIVNLYHKNLPELPRVKQWPENLQAILRTRWKEDPVRQNLAWWEQFFRYVQESDFLTGRTKEAFVADLEWLVRPKNFTKIANGRYHGRGGVAKPQPGISAWLEERNHATTG